MTENWNQLKGQVVDGAFPLIEFLGGSGAGVFLTSGTDGAKLAVKLIPVPADPVAAEAQLTQWKSAEGLSHPHLLRAVRSGRCNLNSADFLFLVMEYAEENLAQVLPERALTAEETREMLPAVLDALDYLHGKGLVHGNLHPGNIMAAGDQLKLSSDRIMRIGDVPKFEGTYSAPESPRGVTPASDLWSLGFTLAEVLTQRRPTWEPGGTLAQLPDNFPEQFRVIAQHCLVRDPNLRCKTSDIRARLKVPEPQAAPAAAPKEKAVVAVTPRKPMPPLRRFAVPVLIVALVIVVVALLSRHDQHSNVREEPTAQLAATEQQKTLEAEAPTPTVEQIKAPASEETKEPEPQEKPSAAVQTASSPVVPPAPEKALSSSGGNDEVVHQVLPEVSRGALNTITGRVRVRVKVHVDPEGNVSQSQFVTSGPSQYFANSAMQAARQWKFSPSASGPRAWNLQFEFRRSGVSAVPTQIAQ